MYKICWSCVFSWTWNCPVFFHRQSTHRYEQLWRNQTNESCTEPWPTGSSQQVPSHSFFSKDEVRRQYLGREGTSTYCLVGISMIFRRGAGSDVMFRIDWSSVTFLVDLCLTALQAVSAHVPALDFTWKPEQEQINLSANEQACQKVYLSCHWSKVSQKCRAL